MTKKPTKAAVAKKKVVDRSRAPTSAAALDRLERFRYGVLEHGNATRAYKEAGYKIHSGASNEAYKLMQNQDTKDWLVAERKKRLDAMSVSVDDMFLRYKHIAFADIAQITTYTTEACRYCWGVDHQYQWRTKREWEAANEEAKAKLKTDDPSDKPIVPMDGGFGYSTNSPPNKSCPECDGKGTGVVTLKNTDEMTPAERAVFVGVEQTQHGIKYKFNDQMAALSQLAEKIEFFKERDDSNVNALANAIREISQRGSRMPLRKEVRKDGEE